MAPVAALGLAAVAALGLLFLAVGARLGAFALGAGIVGVAYGLLFRTLGLPWDDAALLTSASLALWTMGLLVLRIMLRRSVTLRFLLRLSRGDAGGAMQEEIEGRVQELLDLHLAEARGDEVAATPRGRLLGGVASMLYTLFRVGR